MDLLGIIERTWWLGLPTAVFLGAVLGASPLAWPVLAAAVGARAGTSGDRSHPAGRASVLALGAGMTLVYAILGFATGSLDRVIREGFGPWAGIGYALLAALSVALGAVLLARPATLCRVDAQRGAARRGPVGSFLAGIPLGFVNCPACAGVITGVALAAGAAGSTWYAVAVMSALGVGHTLALWFASGLLLRPLREMATRVTTIQRFGGVVLILAGLFFAWQAAGNGLAVSPVLP